MAMAMVAAEVADGGGGDGDVGGGDGDGGGAMLTAVAATAESAAQAVVPTHPVSLPLSRMSATPFNQIGASDGELSKAKEGSRSF